MSIIGIVENVGGFICPHCGTKTDIFQVGGGKKIAEDLNIPFLGSIPIDPKVSEESDKGLFFIVEHADSPASKTFKEIVSKIEDFLKNRERKE